MELVDTIEGMLSRDKIEQIKAEREQTTLRYKEIERQIQQATEEKAILKRQKGIMAEYLLILNERIEYEEARRKEAHDRIMELIEGRR